ncbi:MAG: HesB/IscA family protein [Myxococcota bacterium]
MAVSMTEAAIERVAIIMKKRQTPDAVLRVGVRGGGCSGLSYFMDFVETPEEKDKLFEFGDPAITLAVDRKSYLFLNGTEIDFQTSMMKNGFEFNNPIAGRSCSCGESFTL